MFFFMCVHDFDICISFAIKSMEVRGPSLLTCGYRLDKPALPESCMRSFARGSVFLAGLCGLATTHITQLFDYFQVFIACETVATIICVRLSVGAP